MNLKKAICLLAYYGFAQYLPNSYSKILGSFSNSIRIFLCKRIFKKCGKIRTINRKVNFGSGRDFEMGDNSGIGECAQLPPDTIIGKNVIVSRFVFILHRNHEFARTDIPINDQGYKPFKRSIIEDDCWIGLGSYINPGRTIKRGTIVAMGSVLTKDFPEYSIVGGNPAKLIKSRMTNEE